MDKPLVQATLTAMALGLSDTSWSSQGVAHCCNATAQRVWESGLVEMAGIASSGIHKLSLRC